MNTLRLRELTTSQPPGPSADRQWSALPLSVCSLFLRLNPSCGVQGQGQSACLPLPSGAPCVRSLLPPALAAGRYGEAGSPCTTPGVGVGAPGLWHHLSQAHLPLPALLADRAPVMGPRPSQPAPELPDPPGSHPDPSCPFLPLLPEAGGGLGDSSFGFQTLPCPRQPGSPPPQQGCSLLCGKGGGIHLAPGMRL